MPRLIENSPYWLKLLMALVLGVVLSYSQAPYHSWFLTFISFGGFYFLFETLEKKREVFLLSFIFSIGYFVAGLNWIGNALLVEGNEYRWVWPIAVIALPCLLSLFPALFLSVARYLSKAKTMESFLLFCVLLSLAEFTRSFIFTGFPWNLYGYTWLGLFPIAQSVSLIGPFGLTFLTIFWGAVFGFVSIHCQKSIPVFTIALATFLMTYGYGFYRLDSAIVNGNEDIAVTVVQPNIPQAEKWDPDKLVANFEKHMELSSQQSNVKKEIIIWPETAIPPALINAPSVKQRLQSILNEHRILLSGGLAITQDPKTQKREYHNAVFQFDGRSTPERLYNKSHLVPFGEYIPFQQFIPLTPVVNFTGFQKGNGATTIDLAGWPSFSPQICYEIIFPNRMVAKDAERPDFILTVTNDAWYGGSPGPRQHFAQARFRAIEQAIPVIRSANTGISGIIDPYGRVVEKLSLLESGFIQQNLPKSLSNRTLYSSVSNWLYLIFCGSVFAILFICRRFLK
ncbi:MAG: apolipoprotein N-acyltransferase [Pseudomonadota bacterium]